MRSTRHGKEKRSIPKSKKMKVEVFEELEVSEKKCSISFEEQADDYLSELTIPSVEADMEVTDLSEELTIPSVKSEMIDEKKEVVKKIEIQQPEPKKSNYSPLYKGYKIVADVKWDDLTSTSNWSWHLRFWRLLGLEKVPNENCRELVWLILRIVYEIALDNKQDEKIEMALARLISSKTQVIKEADRQRCFQLLVNNKIIGYEKSVIGDIKSVIGDIKSVIGDIKSVIGDVKPVIVDVKPVIGDVKPVIGDVKPVIGEEKPVIGEEKPVIEEEKSLIGKVLDVLNFWS